MARIYSLGDEKINFIGVMELKSVMEMDQHSKNSRNGSWSTMDSDLLLSIIIDTVGLIQKVYINRLLTHQDFVGLKGVRIHTRPKGIMDQVISAQ